MATFMGQKAKMLAGELYQASDPELQAAHLRAQAILAQFNVTPADAEEERRNLLTSLFARFGEGAVIKPLLRCDYGSNITVGARSFMNFDCVLLDCNRITIATTCSSARASTSTPPGTRSRPHCGDRVPSSRCR